MRKRSSGPGFRGLRGKYCCLGGVLHSARIEASAANTPSNRPTGALMQSPRKDDGQKRQATRTIAQRELTLKSRRRAANTIATTWIRTWVARRSAHGVQGRQFAVIATGPRQAGGLASWRSTPKSGGAAKRLLDRNIYPETPLKTAERRWFEI